MDHNPIRTAVRRMRRAEGTDVCCFCGRKDRVTRIQASGRFRRQLERHHVVGRKHDSELIIQVCRHCHDLLTEGLLREGISMLFEPNRVTRAANILKAQAAFLEEFANAQRRLADTLQKEKK